MTSHPLGLRLAAIELVQQEGARLGPFDHGLLVAARHTGDPELCARVDAIQRLEALRDRKRARARKRTEDDE